MELAPQNLIDDSIAAMRLLAFELDSSAEARCLRRAVPRSLRRLGKTPWMPCSRSCFQIGAPHYDRVDIRKLSPGTRGIVLLLLYLALDDLDDRPLIIAVFDELVALFIDAKTKRQVIIVTHNANLVIITDADQIIIAEAGPHPSDGLPPISYVAGGLEDAAIRKEVCDILEGGEAAFRERGGFVYGLIASLIA